MICGAKVGLDGTSYHTGTPKVKLIRLRVFMTSLLTIPDGGKTNEMVCMGNEP